MDVAAWLRGLGLEQYAQLFRDNDIDGEIPSSEHPVMPRSPGEA
jgi:SAM domain (Sterile alpha motif)